MNEQFGAQLQAASVIHCKYPHCCSSDRRPPFDSRAQKKKVLSPSVTSRVKKRYKLTTEWIDACEVRAFFKIAAMARKREVLNRVGAPMLSGKDVLDVMRQVAVFLSQ